MSEGTAKSEAKRLAVMNPSQQFVVFEATSVFECQPVNETKL